MRRILKMASENKITKKDLDRLAMRSLFEQSCFSFERMQAVGFAWGMGECFRKIFGNNNDEMAGALKNNLDFINTEPHMAAILQGLIVSMEESHQDRELIHSLKTGLFGPLAGLGDAIWWYTAMPIIAAICCSLAGQCTGSDRLHRFLGDYSNLQPYPVCQDGL